MIDSSSGYTTSSPIIIPTGKPISNPRAYTISYPDYFNQGIQESQVSLKGVLIFHPSYHPVFFLNSKSHMDAMMRESDNIPHWDIYSVL